MARGFPEGSSLLQLLNLLKPSQATLTKSSFLQSVVWFGLSSLWEARVSSLLQLLNLLKLKQATSMALVDTKSSFLQSVAVVWLVCHSCGKPECLVDSKQHHVAEPVCQALCCSQGVAILNQCQHWLRYLFLEEQQSLIIIHSFIEVKVQQQDKVHFKKDCGYMQQQKF